MSDTSAHREDRALARCLLAGDRPAFKQFFDDYFSRLYRFIARRTDDPESARDIVQAALIKGVRKLDTYRGEASLFTWLCQIARRELADQTERQNTQTRVTVALENDPSVRASLESMQWSTETDPQSRIEDDEAQELVHAALDYLPARYAKLLELKYVEELSVERIAENLGLSAIAVQSLLARARRAFRESYRTLTDGIHDLGTSSPALGRESQKA